jgi:hypothetical protein
VLAFIDNKKGATIIGRPLQRFRITTVVSYDTGFRLPVRFRYVGIYPSTSHDFLLLSRLMVLPCTSNNFSFAPGANRETKQKLEYGNQGFTKARPEPERFIEINMSPFYSAAAELIAVTDKCPQLQN